MKYASDHVEEHKRLLQEAKYRSFYVYSLHGEVPTQEEFTRDVLIEENTEFHCSYISGSAYSFDPDPGKASQIPLEVETLAGNERLEWAGHGLFMRIIDAGANMPLGDGFLPFDVICSPGYDVSMQAPRPFRRTFRQNTNIRFVMRNVDYANNRTHRFNIALIGHKVDLKKREEVLNAVN